jgi:hypothetical protein
MATNDIIPRTKKIQKSIKPMVRILLNLAALSGSE